MDYFAYLIANRSSTTKMVKIRKVYVNEDPNQEDTVPCPKCIARNRKSSVRYMYVNIQEAIYKCESPECMYPFQNFKFKNYTDNTVYFYISAEETSGANLNDFESSIASEVSPAQLKIETLQTDNSPMAIDFSLHFFSPERVTDNSVKPPEHTPNDTSVNIFDSPTLSYKNLVQDFDTGFIDDLLNDLGQQSTPEKQKPVLVSPVSVVDNKSSSANGRQLKRCLQMFQKTVSPSETTFKVPPLPGAEVQSPPKIRIKKNSPLRRHKHIRRTNSSSSSLTLEKPPPKRRKVKPLEFIESIISKTPKDDEPKPKQSNNQRVENMLNFIERSMKNRQSQPAETNSQALPLSLARHSTSYYTETHRNHKKKQHLSLSAAVLDDREFEYSASESEQEDAPEMVPVTPKVKSSPASDVSTVTSLPTSSSQQSCDSDPSLPSFEDLLMHIHPGQPKLQPSFQNVGFRSAGSSPTRVPQWAKTPPRRVHSMESLCSLLE